MSLPVYGGNIGVERTPGGILLTGLGRFNLEYSAECGQAFRWDWDCAAECYTGVVRGRVLRARQDADTVLLVGSDDTDDASLFVDYFNIRQDSKAVEEALAAMDENLAAAVARHPGMKIARQEPWECVISYIISARNNIPSIKRTVAELSRRFGERVAGTDHYAFPTPEALAAAPLEELLECKAAFRTRYIQATARAVLEGAVDLGAVAAMGIGEARAELTKLPGIGPKVADCVMLFSMDKYGGFPIDVWIARAMQHWYLGGEERPLREVQALAAERFGDLAGYANQHLFFHARDIRLGRRTECQSVPVLNPASPVGIA